MLIPTLRAVLPALALLGAAPAAVRGADPAAGGLSAKAAKGKLEAWQAELLRREAEMETAFGYAGSKRTVTDAFQRAKVPDDELSRASAWAGKLYVLWGRVKPLYAAESKALAETARVVEEEGSLTAEDLAWIEHQWSGVIRAAEGLEAGMHRLVALRVEGTLLAREAQEKKVKLDRSREVLSRLGGGKGALAEGEVALEELGGRIAAASANEAWLEEALAADATRRWFVPLVPHAARKKLAVSSLAVSLAGGAPGPPVVEPAVPPGSLAGLALVSAEASRALDVLDEEARAHRAAYDAEIAQVSALEDRLASIQTAEEMDDARAVTARIREVEDALDATRAEIAAAPIGTPAGRKKAEALAKKVLDLRARLPELKRVKAELSRPDVLTAWQRTVLGERSARLASAARSRQGETAAVGALVLAAGSILQSEARRTLGEAEALLRKVERLASVVRSAPDAPAKIDVLAGDALVFTARRVNLDELDRARRALESARAEVRALSDLRLGLDVGMVGAAVYAEAARVEEGPSAPPPVDPKGLEATLSALAEDEVLRNPFDKGTRATLAWRFRVVGSGTEDAGAALRLRADRTVGSARDAFAGRALKPPAAPESILVEALLEAMARLDRLLGERRERLDAEVRRLVPEDPAGVASDAVRTGATRRYATALLSTLLHVPLAEAADAALVSALADLRRTLAANDALSVDVDAADGYERHRKADFTEGRAVRVVVTPPLPTRGAPPPSPPASVRLGGAEVPLQSREAGAFVHLLRRAEDLPESAPDGSLTLELSTPAP